MTCCHVMTCNAYNDLLPMIMRLIRLVISLWMHVDVALDIRQTYIYYGHSFNPDGIYNAWALNYTKSNGNYTESVSAGYFYSAMCTWIAPPLFVCMLFFLTEVCEDEFDPFGVTNDVVLHPILKFQNFICIQNFQLKPFFKSKCLNVLLYPFFYFPVEMISGSIFVYIIIPYVSLRSALTIAWKGKIDPEEELLEDFPAKLVPFFKLFENLGEAVPQFIITMVFLLNNMDYIYKFDQTFFSIPITIISLVFSAGSIVMGLYTCITSCKNICNDPQF